MKPLLDDQSVILCGSAYLRSGAIISSVEYTKSVLFD